MRSTFSSIFYLKRQVVKKDGTVPVMGRITIDGTQAVQLQADHRPETLGHEGRTGDRPQCGSIGDNRMLDKIRVKINSHYQEILDRDNYVTAEKVKNAFLGLEHRQHTLLKVFEQYNEDYEKLVKAGMKSPKKPEQVSGRLQASERVSLPAVPCERHRTERACPRFHH